VNICFRRSRRALDGNAWEEFQSGRERRRRVTSFVSWAVMEHRCITTTRLIPRGTASEAIPFVRCDPQDRFDDLPFDSDDHGRDSSTQPIHVISDLSLNPPFRAFLSNALRSFPSRCHFVRCCQSETHGNSESRPPALEARDLSCHKLSPLFWVKTDANSTFGTFSRSNLGGGTPRLQKVPSIIHGHPIAPTDRTFYRTPP
jgi:hypothetical protein